MVCANYGSLWRLEWHHSKAVSCVPVGLQLSQGTVNTRVFFFPSWNSHSCSYTPRYMHHPWTRCLCSALVKILSDMCLKSGSWIALRASLTPELLWASSALPSRDPTEQGVADCSCFWVPQTPRSGVIACGMQGTHLLRWTRAFDSPACSPF